VLDEPDTKRDPVAEPTENLEALTPAEGKVIPDEGKVIPDEGKVILPG